MNQRWQQNQDIIKLTGCTYREADAKRLDAKARGLTHDQLLIELAPPKRTLRPEPKTEDRRDKEIRQIMEALGCGYTRARVHRSEATNAGESIDAYLKRVKKRSTRFKASLMVELTIDDPHVTADMVRDWVVSHFQGEGLAKAHVLTVEKL